MAVDKRIFVSPEGGAWKGGMDKDSHERYVGQGYYRDARNVNFMVDGDRFVLSNVKGNSQVSHTLPLGDNIVIGSFDDKANQQIFYFVFNTSNNHSIVRYNYSKSSASTMEELAEGSGLNFKEENLITGIDIILDRFLVFTDDVNEIGCIDLENLPSTTITSSNRWEIELLKITNLEPLDCIWVTDRNRKRNALHGKLYQFCYRYIYRGGFRSVVSQISRTSLPDYDFYESNDGYRSYYDNGINIIIPKPSFDQVESVEIFAREEVSDDTKSSEIWYKIKSIPYDEINDSHLTTYMFTGEEEKIPQDSSEFLAEATVFPKKAKDLIFLPSNVLAFGNITEDFDSNIEVKSAIYPSYRARTFGDPIGSPTTTTSFSATPISVTAFDLYNPSFDLRMSADTYTELDVTGTPQKGDVLVLTLTVTYTDNSPVASTLPVTLPSTQDFDVIYVVKQEDIEGTVSENREAVAKKLVRCVNSIDTRAEGFGGVIAIQNNNSVRFFDGEVENDNPYVVSSVVTAVASSIVRSFPEDPDFPGYGIVPWIRFFTEKTFKRSAIHKFAIQYKDSKGRRSSAFSLGEAFVDSVNDTTNKGRVDMNIVINSLAPDWAEYYDILYAKNKTAEDWIQAYTTISKVEHHDTSDNVYRANIYKTLSRYNDVYKDTDYAYSFADGDRIILKGTVVNNTFSELTEDLEISLAGDDSLGVLFKYDLSNLTTYPTDVYEVVEDVQFSQDSLASDTGTITLIGSNKGLNAGDTITITKANNPKNNGTYNIVDTLHAGANDILYVDAAFLDDRVSASTQTPIKFDNVAKTVTITNPEDAQLLNDTLSYVDTNEIFLDNFVTPFSVANGSQTVVNKTYDSTAGTYEFQLDSSVSLGGTGDAYVGNIGFNTGEATVTIEGGKVFWVEIRRSGIPSEVYNEIAFQGTIDANQRHSGNVSDQTANDGAQIELKGYGDAFLSFVPEFIQSRITTASYQYGENKFASPYYKSEVTDISRSNSLASLYEEKNRETTITYTQPILNTTALNGLSVILPTSINDFDKMFGSIQRMELRHNKQMILYFEDKVGQVGVFEELQRANTGDIIYQTEALFNGINYYSYNGGIGLNPESFSQSDTVHYFASPNNGEICRLSDNGITPISQYGLKSWFYDNLDPKQNYQYGLKLLSGFSDRDKLYYIAIIGNINFPTISVVNSSTIDATPDVTGSYDETLLSIGDTMIITTTTGGTALASVTGVSYIGPAIRVSFLGGVSASNIDSFKVAQNKGTLAFNEDANAWVSYFDFEPDFIGTVGFDLVSFKNGDLWIHNNDTRGSFYGSTNPATVTIPFNDNAPVMKQYQTLEIEGTSVWKSDTDGDVVTLNGQSSLLEEGFYSQYQPGEFSAAFRQDTNTPNTSYPLLDGYDLRDRVIIIKFKNENTDKQILESVGIQYYPSEASL